MSQVSFHVSGLSGLTGQFSNGTPEFSELVLARMALLMDQSRSVLPIRAIVYPHFKMADAYLYCDNTQTETHTWKNFKKKKKFKKTECKKSMTGLEPGTGVTTYCHCTIHSIAANTSILLYVYEKFVFCPFLRNKRNPDPNLNPH